MTRPRAIGAYIFAGGFTVGVSRHFDVACHLEETRYGVDTFRANFPDIPVHVGIERWPIAELREHELDFIYGNPPCAAWSQAGAATKKGRHYSSSPLVACTERYFGLLEQLRPKVWAWESVQRAWELGEDFVRGLALRARDLGYSSTIFLHDAAYLGAPQHRRRFFLICHRIEGRLALPDFDRVTTIEDALRGLNDPGEPLDRNCRKVAHLIPQVRQGENLSSAFDRLVPAEQRLTGARGQIVGRPPFTIKRARSGVPAPVVMHELIHPTEDRALSVKELAILCGYPATYEFVGATDAGQVGRGICPPVGEYLARNVARAVAANRIVTDPVLTLVDYTEPPGTVERLSWGDPASPELSSLVPDEAAADATDIQLAMRFQMPEAPPARASFASRRRARPVAAEPQAENRDGGELQSRTLPTEGRTLPSSTRPFDGEGSGKFIRRLLRAGADGKEVLALVHSHYPDSKATMGDINWNRGRIRKEDAANINGVTLEKQTRRKNAEPDAEPAQLPGQTAQPARSVNAEPHVAQPQATRQGVDPDRAFDKSSLRANSHGKWQSRDYAAHFFRWSWAARFVNDEVEVLDVGCGADVPMIHVLTMPRSSVPRRYVGVDLNRAPREPPTRQWATLHWEFNFLENHAELGQFDLVTNFEMIEHMRKADGMRLLAGLRECLKPDGTLLLSTPVFNGRAAANHLHEWQIDELREAIEASGLRVEARYGTFASANDIRRVATEAERALIDELTKFHSGEVMACFIAPKYPDASRNNIWKLKRA